MTPSDPGELIAAVATASGVDETQVQAILVDNAINLVPRAPARRNLKIHRLSFTGTKSGTARWDGPINGDFEFGEGVTAFSSDANLRGKTTILELITWALRGTARNLRVDVRSWLDRIALEYSVNGVPMAVVLTRQEHGFVADVLRGASVESVSAVVRGDGEVTDVHVLADGLSESQFAIWQDAQMSADLQLDAMTNFKRSPGSNDGNAEQHTWPAYFGGLYLPPAGDNVILGDVAMAGLPARILQMFCNIPLMAASLRLKTLVKQRSQDAANQARRTALDAAARGAERASLEIQLAAVREELAAAAETGRPSETIVAELRAAEINVSMSAARVSEATRTLGDARSARQAEEFLVNNARESELAAIIFQGLSPRSCPRCEQRITNDRNARERDLHQCSVCTEPLPESAVEEELDPAESDGASIDTLAALRLAEEAADASLADAMRRAGEASELATALATELTAASQAEAFAKGLGLQLEEAHLLGRIEATPEVGGAIEQTTELRVLLAAARVIDDITKAAALEAFQQIDAEVATLARSFGIANLDSVALNRAGAMAVTTAHTTGPFSGLSGGEKLRLRVALVVALLRVGHQAGVGSHPGLILLDSPGSEELTVADESTLLRELVALTGEFTDLQLVVASAEPAAVNGAVPSSQVYAATGDAPLW